MLHRNSYLSEVFQLIKLFLYIRIDVKTSISGLVNHPVALFSVILENRSESTVTLGIIKLNNIGMFCPSVIINTNRCLNHNK